MKISTLVNAHGNTAIVADSIDAIKTWVSDDVLMIVDDAHWESWGKDVSLPVHKLQGLYHNYYRAPYRNLTCGLKSLVDLWNDCDWYCYCEYDVLFTSDAFKQDLVELSDDVWMVGNDARLNTPQRFPFLERILKTSLINSHYLLGCCVFYKGDFLRKLRDDNFFDRFLMYTNDFSNGHFPDCKEEDVWDFGEFLYPTLAGYYGGKIKGMAYWHQRLEQWQGQFKKYPMRWKPELTWEDNSGYASIMHPLKENMDLRWFHKIKRQRLKNARV